MEKNSKTTVQARKKFAARKQGPRRSSHGRTTPKPASRPKAATPAPRNASGKHRVEPVATVTTFAFYVNPTLALVCIPADAPILFSLETAANLTGVHPEMLRYYCRRGLLGPQRAEREREPTFDEEALQEVRRIEYYRRHLAVSRQALPLICELRREAERQHIEIHFLRSP
jgi:hypothetical protein